MEDQGRFVIGYYHQRQDFYSKKESEDQNSKADEASKDAEKQNTEATEVNKEARNV
jgi:hypothetical protein